MSFQAYIEVYSEVTKTYRSIKPKTKAELKRAVAEGKDVYVQDTSMFGNRSGPISNLRPEDVIVGPDVYTKRSWYANYKNGKVV